MTENTNQSGSQTRSRHAEIAGAGIVGLGTGTLLARSGWTVRIHERSSEIREVGAAVGIRGAGLDVLRRIGVVEQLEGRAVVLDREEKRDANGKILLQRDRTAATTSYNPLRDDLIGIMADVAAESGVDIQTDSLVRDATPDGTLTLADGTELSADLVVAADGFRSRIRYNAGLEEKAAFYHSGTTRVLMPREDEPNVSQEWWSGRLRIGIAPTTDDITYVFLSAPQSDARAVSVPIDAAYWATAFPGLPRRFFDRVHAGDGIRHPYPLVISKSWAKGTLALVGDAAAALPPTLGLGASLGLTNAYNLVSAVNVPDVPVAAALNTWDEICRPMAERVQRRAGMYNALTVRWPQRFESTRNRFIRLLQSPKIHTRMFKPGVLLSPEKLIPKGD
jgi:2-polyprenyl-6-methoxyphenol hydroxylase-like FAD-dependent oxidoreductase